MPVKWGKEQLRRRQELIESLSARNPRPYADKSQEEIEALKRLPFGPWIKEFLPEQFKIADAPFHTAADARKDIVGIPVGNCWFGGSGKTWRYVVANGVYRHCQRTYVCKRRDGTFVALPSHEALDPTRDDLVGKVLLGLRVVGCRNVRKAAEKLDMIRLVLKLSPELKAVYGDAIVPSEGEDAEVDFTANGVRTVGMGIGMDIRGAMQIGGPRVQEINYDDIENIEIAVSKEQEDKIDDQIFLGWLARCEAGGLEAVVTAQMNQYRSKHCQARRWKAASLEVDPDTGKPKALFQTQALDDGEFHSNWPARYPDSACKRLHFQFGSTRYNVEYRCREVNEDSRIKAEWFPRFSVAKLLPSELAKMRIVAALDPSHKSKESGDFKAWVVMGGIPKQRGKFILHVWAKHCGPAELIEHQFWIEDHFPTARLVMEEEAVVEFYASLYAAMCREKKRNPRAIGKISHSGQNKKDRILTDEGEWERGEWRVDPSEGETALFLDQAEALPDEKAHDDVVDAAEMASAELDPLILGGDGPSIRLGLKRDDVGAMFGAPARRSAPRPGSDEERYDREGESRFERLATARGGIVI